MVKSINELKKKKELEFGNFIILNNNYYYHIYLDETVK